MILTKASEDKASEFQTAVSNIWRSQSASKTISLILHVVAAIAWRWKEDWWDFHFVCVFYFRIGRTSNPSSSKGGPRDLVIGKEQTNLHQQKNNIDTAAAPFHQRILTMTVLFSTNAAAIVLLFCSTQANAELLPVEGARPHSFREGEGYVIFY